MAITLLSSLAASGTVWWTGTEHEAWVELTVPKGTDLMVLVYQTSNATTRAELDGRLMRRLFSQDTSNISTIAVCEYVRPPAGLRRMRVVQPPAYTAVMAVVMLSGVDLRRPRGLDLVRGSAVSTTYSVTAPSERGAFVVGGVTVDNATPFPTPAATQVSLYSGQGHQSSSVFAVSYRRATGVTTALSWTNPNTFSEVVAVSLRPARVRPTMLAPLARYSAASLSVTARKTI